jgi:polar amino acid transport system ATP-binding protein
VVLDVSNNEKVKTSFPPDIKSEIDITIIFSTHDIHLAVELADSIYILSHPKVLQIIVPLLNILI